MKLQRYDHLVITTQDEEKCIHFYRDILGMEEDNRGGRIAFRFGNAKINIHRKKAEFLPAAEHVTYGSQDLCLIAEGNIEEIKQELLDKGYPVELGPVKRTGALGEITSIYLRDPDGNLIEIAVY